MALLDFVRDYPGEPTPERYHQEGKTNLDLLEQEIVSGSGTTTTIHLTLHNIYLSPKMMISSKDLPQNFTKRCSCINKSQSYHCLIDSFQVNT